MKHTFKRTNQNSQAKFGQEHLMLSSKQNSQWLNESTQDGVGPQKVINYSKNMLGVKPMNLRKNISFNIKTNIIRSSKINSKQTHMTSHPTHTLTINQIR